MTVSLNNLLLALVIICLCSLVIYPVTKVGSGNDYLNPLLESSESTQAAAIANNLVRMVQQGDFRELSKHYSQYINNENIGALVSEVQQSFPAQAPDRIILVGLQQVHGFINGEDQDITDAVLQYQFGSKFYVVNVSYSIKNDLTKILGLHFSESLNSLDEINKVVFANTSMLHYVVLAVTILIPVIILTALILCVRTTKLERRWLWIVFIIFGLVGFHFNWTAQTFTFNPIMLQLMGVSYFRFSRYAPLIINFSMPVGAICFIAKHIFSKIKIQS